MALVPFGVPTASVSPDTNPEEILTLACAKFSLSISETTTLEFNNVAAAFSL